MKAYLLNNVSANLRKIIFLVDERGNIEIGNIGVLCMDETQFSVDRVVTPKEEKLGNVLRSNLFSKDALLAQATPDLSTSGWNISIILGPSMFQDFGYINVTLNSQIVPLLEKTLEGHKAKVVFTLKRFWQDKSGVIREPEWKTFRTAELKLSKLVGSHLVKIMSEPVHRRPGWWWNSKRRRIGETYITLELFID